MSLTNARFLPAALGLVVALCGIVAGLTARQPLGGGSSAVPFVTPAGPGSGMYGMSADGRGGAYLVWIEPAPGGAQGDGHLLRFSRLVEGAWRPARTIATARNWFVNWADHPSIAVLPDGSLVTHWLVNNEQKAGSYGYGIRVARSTDDGATWQEVFSAGTDNVRDYSGFVSFLPAAHTLDAVYLTPSRDAGATGHVMTLALARFGQDGHLRSTAVIDADTCSCCTTSIVKTSRGAIAAYRDHQAGEIRDIAVVREINGRWTEPSLVHRDGWRISGCPTNGPVLSADADRVAVAWFTAAGDVPHVKVAFSSDSGARFAAPVIVDGGRPVGWPSTVLLDDGGAVVSWLESTGGGAGEIRLRRVTPAGALGPPVVVAAAAAGRSTGIPQMVRTRGGLTLAWRSGERVVSASMPIPSL